jgi:peroxiredoxin
VNKSRWLLLLVAGLLGAGGGWWFTDAVLKEPKSAVASQSPSADSLIGQQRPEFSLGSTTGDMISAGQFDGKVLLVNFWATWCTPCREEMPMLSDLHENMKDQGFSVLGIALDDVDQARDFVEELGINYPNAVGGADVMAVGVKYGNRAGLLPYSVLIDREGVVRWTSLGELEADDIEARITDLL